MDQALGISAVEVTFAAAGRRDLDDLARLYVQMSSDYPVDQAAEKVGKMLDAGHGAALMRNGAEPIGCILWMDMGDHVFVRNYVIAEGHRGRGLGAALFHRLRAEVLPPKPLRLEASEDGARAFWSKQGFGPWSTGMRDDL
ncbi:MAG: GNAT family N-acetyltransferase [Pseudomonadota bacterium]